MYNDLIKYLYHYKSKIKIEKKPYKFWNLRFICRNSFAIFTLGWIRRPINKNSVSEIFANFSPERLERGYGQLAKYQLANLQSKRTRPAPKFRFYWLRFVDLVNSATCLSFVCAFTTADRILVYRPCMSGCELAHSTSEPRTIGTSGKQCINIVVKLSQT